VAERIISDRSREGKNTERMKIDISFRNGKSEKVEIILREPVIGKREYRVLSSNIKPYRQDATKIEFRVPVAANQTTTLNFEILYTW